MGGVRSAQVRLRNAIATGNVLLVDAAAAECGHIDTDDALAICLVYLEADPERYQRAAARWLAQLARRERLGVVDVLNLATALVALTERGGRPARRRQLAAQLQLLGLERCAASAAPAAS